MSSPSVVRHDGRAHRWIRRITRITFGCVGLLALIAGTVSYLHMHALVAMHGQPAWVAALTPLSVDGMIVAASTTLLADSRSGNRGAVLPWALLAVGSIASLAANVAVAEPTATGRVIAAWPAWLSALANRAADGSLPSGKAIASRYGRHGRWGRMVKHTGAAREFANAAAESP